jgi:murein tripeptide amidase MpaA
LGVVVGLTVFLPPPPPPPPPPPLAKTFNTYNTYNTQHKTQNPHSASSYPSGWPNYKVCASYDREYWFRCPDTTFDAATGVLQWHHAMPAGQSTIWFAYFAPYSYERHQDLIAKCAASPFAQLRTLGTTLDGRDIDMLVVGTGAKKFFITARQHPGESMAEWCAEGFLERLLSADDPMAKKLRAEATCFVTPNANPDGSVRGHLRTNACGANLNREWAPTGDYMAPTLERSPEVYHIMRVLDEQGCDGYMDIHGDEEIEVSET